jgi:hypothetical protein
MDDHGVINQAAESDEEILTFDVSDEALGELRALSSKRSLGYIALGVGSTARLNSTQNALRQFSDIYRNPPRLTIKLSPAQLIARISPAAGPCRPVGLFPETPYGSFRSAHRL